MFLETKKNAKKTASTSFNSTNNQKSNNKNAKSGKNKSSKNSGLPSSRESPREDDDDWEYDSDHLSPSTSYFDVILTPSSSRGKKRGDSTASSTVSGRDVSPPHSRSGMKPKIVIHAPFEKIEFPMHTMGKEAEGKVIEKSPIA